MRFVGAASMAMAMAACSAFGGESRPAPVDTSVDAGSAATGDATAEPPPEGGAPTPGADGGAEAGTDAGPQPTVETGVVDGKCFVKSLGGKVGVTSYAGSGNQEWTDHAAGQTTDGSLASVTLSPGQQSKVLRLSQLGLTIPSNSTVLGVVATITRKAAGNIIDARVSLADQESVLIRHNKASAAPWPSDVEAASYGKRDDLWLEPYTPEDIEDPGFGVGLEAKNGGTVPATAYVDGMSVTVYYSCP